jgi:tetratricopeptide (TPR) repeat protein
MSSRSDTMARYIMESGEWLLASTIPSLPTSRDFAAMRLQIDAMASAQRHDHSAAQAAADRLTALADEPGQRQLAKEVLNIQAREAQAVAVLASGDPSKALAIMDAAAAIEDSIYALSQPPYPPIPVHEPYGTILLEMKRPAQAREQFAKTLTRTPGRPKAIFDLARAALTLGDRRTAAKQYESFLQLWKRADQIARRSSRQNDSLLRTRSNSSRLAKEGRANLKEFRQDNNANLWPAALRHV